MQEIIFFHEFQSLVEFPEKCAVGIAVTRSNPRFFPEIDSSKSVVPHRIPMKITGEYMWLDD